MMYVAGDQEGSSNDDVYNAFAYGLWSEAGGNQADSISVPDNGNVNDKTVGPGVPCLRVQGDGGAPLLEACDATNPNQYWNFNSP